jgi:hypothetical protein
MFQTQDDPYFIPKILYFRPQKTMFQTEENIISNPQKPKSRCHNKKMNQKHESYHHHILGLGFRNGHLAP